MQKIYGSPVVFPAYMLNNRICADDVSSLNILLLCAFLTTVACGRVRITACIVVQMQCYGRLRFPIWEHAIFGPRHTVTPVDRSI
jgi:hypothetical protein